MAESDKTHETIDRVAPDLTLSTPVYGTAGAGGRPLTLHLLQPVR